MRIFLAPMEGVVDFHLRKLYAYIGGIDTCVTEFVRVNEHTLPRRVFTNRCPELIPKNRQFTINSSPVSSIPIRVQLLGSDPTVLANNAKKAATEGAIGIDLNFGCPAKTVNRSRGGACLLDETRLLFDIVSAVREAVPSKIPVTAKIRLGYNDRLSYLDNAIAIEKAGADELFVHARSKADGYKPPAYWHLIANIRAKLSIPVIANGEIWTLDDYINCKTQSGCSDFMLGRGLLANPGLAKEIKAYETAKTVSPTPWAEVLGLLTHFFEETSQAYPAKYMGNRVKQWLHYLRLHYPEAGQLFEQIKREKQKHTIMRLLESDKYSDKYSDSHATEFEAPKQEPAALLPAQSPE